MLEEMGIYETKLRRALDIALKLLPQTASAQLSDLVSESSSARQERMERAQEAVRQRAAGWFSRDGELLIAGAKEISNAEGQSSVHIKHLLCSLATTECGAQKILNSSNTFENLKQCFNSVAHSEPVHESDNESLFTSTVVELLEASYAEARQLGAESVGSEHILLALVRPCSASPEPLSALLTDPNASLFEDARKLCSEITRYCFDGSVAADTKTREQSSSQIADRETLILTQRALRALERAVVESRRAGKERLEISHLVLGLISEAEHSASEFVNERRIEVGLVRENLWETGAPTSAIKVGTGAIPTDLSQLDAVLLQAAKEAEETRTTFIDINHIALAILDVAPDSVTDLLKVFQMPPVYMRRRLRWCLMWSMRQREYREQVIVTLTRENLAEKFAHLDLSVLSEQPGQIKKSAALDQILTSAQFEALRDNATKISERHILIAIAAYSDPKLKRIFGMLGLTQTDVNKLLDREVGAGRSGTSGILTPRATELMTAAEQVAAELNAPVLLPQHVLLALAEKAKKWPLIFDQLNVKPAELRRAALESLE
ncbi:MAG TPA: Clp protease N-terminal domain-containing protein [Planktothrix sp.]